MTDRELLELAAKAAKHAGMDVEFEPESGKAFDRDSFEWMPLIDDGDALRLAVKLSIHITISDYQRTVCRQGNEFRSIESHEDDPYSATRRAIVRAAAEIGRAMP